MPRSAQLLEASAVRRPLSNGRQGSKGSNPASEDRRVAVATGRALVCANASTAAPQTASREQQLHRPLVARQQAHPLEKPGPSVVSEQLLQRGCSSSSTRPTADMRLHASGAVPVTGAISDAESHQQPENKTGDSLSDLLHKPLLPRNAPLYNRLAEQMLDPRQAKVSKPQGRGVLQGRGPAADFDDEARKLWARLNLDPTKVNNGPHNSLDPLWRHPQSGGTLYVGNEVAARTLSLLQSYSITHVVNCTDSIPLYHDKHPGAQITYLRFDITSHYDRARTDKAAVSFVEPMLTFVADALSKGKSVMVHCLAGAHRAGTTGILCLMRFAKLSPKDATFTAKQCRPIIDPICDFPLLLARVDRGWEQQE